MTADETYDWLTASRQDFATHVLASILALSLAEAETADRPLAETAGFDTPSPVLLGLFPHATDLLTTGGPLAREEDEACLFELLTRGATTGCGFELVLAGLIARRAQRPNHLWQDLGLRDRGELSRLMTDWFAPLARRNKQDMKWKKFFFRMICRDAAYTLCTAPSCGECCDYDNCFSEESGESLLAHLRRTSEAGYCAEPDLSGFRQSPKPLES